MDSNSLLDILNLIDSWVWGVPLLVLLIGTGLWLTIRLELLQVIHLPKALSLIAVTSNDGEGDISSFRSLCTALAATVGVGNIVGVATAITTGGPGAMFWMWLAAFFGMATKYAEGLLAIKYRVTDEKGEISGGPMRYIEMGMGKKFKWLAVMFAVFGASAAILGIGTTTQANAVTEAIQGAFGIPTAWTGGVITVVIAVIILGGIQSISSVSSKLVPFMAVMYVFFGCMLLLSNVGKIPFAFDLIMHSAFTGHAALGGFLGATIMMAMRTGVARGMFSNESGLGSAPIAAAAAKTKWPAEQGLISMTGTFIDTIIICSITGLSILVTGAWEGTERGAAVTQKAFASVYPLSGPSILTISLALFAFTTILGWNYYGERCVVYLFGIKGILPYRVLFIAAVGIAPYIKLDAIWAIADITNGLMAIPNLIALLALSGVVAAETKKYFDHLAELRDKKKKAH